MKNNKIERINNIIDKLYANGITITEITKILNEKGIKSIQGGRWHWSSVKRVVSRKERVKPWRIGSQIPYGFKVSKNGVDFDEHDAEQAIISEMKNLQKAGKTAWYITKNLNSRGIPAKKGGIWHPKSVIDILNRPTRCVSCNSDKQVKGRLKCQDCINKQLDMYRKPDWNMKGKWNE